MEVDEERTNETTPVSASAWWRSRRLRYNVGLIIADVAAFAAYCIVLTIFGDAIQGAEITVFTISLQGIGYLCCMGLANTFYCLGPISERWLQQKDPETYRRTTFALGFWFSIALPFSIPAPLAFLALFYPSYFQP